MAIYKTLFGYLVSVQSGYIQNTVWVFSFSTEWLYTKHCLGIQFQYRVAIYKTLFRYLVSVQSGYIQNNGYLVSVQSGYIQNNGYLVSVQSGYIQNTVWVFSFRERDVAQR